jgi:sporulation protein YlmC with PRC-barrel domain
MHLRLRDLPGRTVLDANGAVVGDIQAPIVDTETWLVDTLRLAVRRRAADELGLRWSWWRRPTIDVPTGLVHAASDAIILRVSLGELRETPPESIAIEHAAAVH